MECKASRQCLSVGKLREVVGASCWWMWKEQDSHAYPLPFLDWLESWTDTADPGRGWGLCSQAASVCGALKATCVVENNTNRFQV